MTDQIEDQADEAEDEAPVDELASLKARARTMGLTFSNNIGLESLRKKVNGALAGEKEEAEEAESEEPEAPAVAAPRKLTKAEQVIEDRKKMRQEQLRLVRVRIANMNPSKKDLAGEIFTVSNRYLGIVKKFVPYGEATDDGYHLEYVLYQQLKDRKFLQIKTRNDKRNPGQIHVEERWVPEFNIELLPALTQAELDALAAQQAAARGMAE